MVDFFKHLDGSGRPIRPVQRNILQWLQDNWYKSDVFIITAPTGVGKSLISKAIQNATGAAIITPSNLLISQYTETYPNTNFLKGKTHYICKTSGIDCKTWTNECEMPACRECPYLLAKGAAYEGEPTIFNPMSLYYATTTLFEKQKFKSLDTIVVDEAHTLPNMTAMLCTKSFRKSQYKFKETDSHATSLERWIVFHVARLFKLLGQYRKAGDANEIKKLTDEISSLELILENIRENPENYATHITKGTHRGKPEQFLNVQSVDPPAFLLNKMLRSKKLVAMSATLFDHDIKALARGRPYLVYDAPSPIPIDSRRVCFKPAPFKMNRDTDPKLMVEAIERIIKINPGLNTIIHITYSMTEKMVPHFTLPIIYNTQYDKEEKVAEFIKNGGIFLAAGCSEGLDLPGDICRLNIIPKLSYPNLGDPVVLKKKSRANGDLWYLMETFKVLIQQIGRSTRGAEDWSKTYILDPSFLNGYNRLKAANALPKSFIESLIFRPWN